MYFTDNSTNSPTSWEWNFGDGTSSTLQNPEHIYSEAGNYTVTLSASNEAGTGTKVRPDYIQVESIQKPVISFWGSRTSGNAPLDVYFTDNSTNSPTAWNWDFGDGENSTEQNPKHTYLTTGNYTVTLSASNEAGTGTKVRPDYIQVESIQKPVISFWGSRTSGNAPLDVYFTDNSTNSPTAWNWDFGDGTSSTLQNPQHIYSEAGNYTVTLFASNEAGTGTKVRQDYIQVMPSLKTPVVIFWGSRTSGNAPLDVYFTDNSTNSPTSWEWNFGDGEFSELQNPQHTYLTAGDYTVTLKVSNAYGSGTKTRQDYINVIGSK